MKKVAFLLALALAGCGGAVIEPGHRGLVFDPQRGGLAHEVLAPGYHRLPGSARIDDFDVTYSRKVVLVHTMTSEALPVDVEIATFYRPIIAELWALDTEIGPAYYEEVVGPEVRAAVLSAMGRHSYAELPKLSAAIESEIENDARRRIAGRHVELASVTFTSVALPPDLAQTVRERITAKEVEAKHLAERAIAAREEKERAEAAWEKEKLEALHKAELRRIEQGGVPCAR